MSTAIYAIGGGLGHLTRSLAVAHTLRADLPTPCTIFVSPGVAAVVERCLPDGLAIRELPIAAASSGTLTQQWVAEQLRTDAPDTLVVDCFPLGIFGELPPVLTAFGGQRLHIARALKSIPRIRDDSLTVLYDTAFTVEPCPPGQLRQLNSLANTLRSLTLKYPTLRHDPPPADWQQSCVIVHSGSDEEIRALLAHADLSFPNLPKILVSTTRPTFPLAPTRWMPLYPAWQWFNQARAIVTACGFNAMAQMRGISIPHAVLPMPRRFDDQARRAR